MNDGGSESFRQPKTEWQGCFLRHDGRAFRRPDAHGRLGSDCDVLRADARRHTAPADHAGIWPKNRVDGVYRNLVDRAHARRGQGSGVFLSLSRILPNYQVEYREDREKASAARAQARRFQRRDFPDVCDSGLCAPHGCCRCGIYRDGRVASFPVRGADELLTAALRSSACPVDGDLYK